jgi:hypothetical protein
MVFEWQWLRGDFDDRNEVNTFSRLKIVVNGQIATRLYDHVAGGERDAVHVALYPLALCIAENWWSLLYEPRKSCVDDSLVEVRHSLDACMNGFEFPALTLWSGGDDAITVECPDIRLQFSNLEFLHPPVWSANLPRAEFEENLFDLVSTVVDRLPQGAGACPLSEAWGRVLGSLGDAGERRYSVAAGRLGIDPYDADALDIAGLAEGISEHLFSDVCEAVTSEELPSAAEWVREGSHRLSTFPEVDIRAFGAVTVRDARTKIWDHGYEAARMVRRKLQLEGLSPHRVVDTIFGAAVRGDAPAFDGTKPTALEGMAGRRAGTMRVAIPKVSAQLRRATLCRASYLAWRIGDGEASAVTTAGTLDQQASRAFAAEMLAPAEWLRERAGPNGLTANDIEAIAEENICPETTVIWQAYNNGSSGNRVGDFEGS